MIKRLILLIACFSMCGFGGVYLLASTNQGTNEVGTVFQGTNKVTAVYVGTNRVYRFKNRNYPRTIK